MMGAGPRAVGEISREILVTELRRQLADLRVIAEFRERARATALRRVLCAGVLLGLTVGVGGGLGLAVWLR